MDLRSLTYLIITMGVFLAPVTIFASQFALFQALKRDKTEMQNVASQLQNSVFSLVMALLMRSPESVRKPSGGGMPPEDEFVDYNTNSDFYGSSNNWSMYPVLENKLKTKKRHNGVITGVLSGIILVLLVLLLL